MVEVMRQYYPAQPGETEPGIFDELMAELLSLNGQATIIQMIRFNERVRHRGGTCPEPEALRQEYQARLDRMIEERSKQIRSGASQPDEFVVFGARALVEKLLDRGLCLIILSGTIEHKVRQEAELLGLAPYFGPHIYGGTVDVSQFSKRKVMDRLLRDEGISGRRLLSFGDGPVELAETKDLDGVAVAVASNEEQNGSGIMDHWKRSQLLQAGADGVIADFRDPDALLKRIFGK
jgi:phosphoglycolate phosphatase-like HAD superfamily hydrolase